MYDYLIVGAGLYAAVFAHEAVKRGKTCLVVEKRNHVGGNIYCEYQDGIWVHRYGAHIFHTSDKEVWDYVNAHAKFRPYRHTVLANYKGTMFNMPFNMNTFARMWNVARPEEAMKIMEEQKAEIQTTPTNLEEQAISMVGRDVYEKLVKGYTEKQWGRDCSKLPSFIIKRLPVRDTYNNDYFNDTYQGMPVGGYNELIERLFQGCTIRLGTDFFENRKELTQQADTIVYTGMIDAFYDYRFGKLEYRSLSFENEDLKDCDNYQGTAVVNYTDRETPYTRIIEHKHFERLEEGHGHTVITKEYPVEWKNGMEPYYPVNDSKNQETYRKYHDLAEHDEVRAEDGKRYIFGGRLAEYKYYDMDKVIASALSRVRKEFAD